MIITLTRADFSSCKIGTLTTFNVRKSTVIGATVNISLSSVERAGYSVATDIATITLNTTNYEGHTVKVMMGSTDVSSWYSSGKVTIPANTSITSNITISVSATAVAPDVPVTPTMYTFTINPTPTTATVTLTATGYTQSGNSISVASGTTVSWTVSADGYYDKTGSETITKDKTLNVRLIEVVDPEDPGTGDGSGDSVNIPEDSTLLLANNTSLTKYHRLAKNAYVANISQTLPANTRIDYIDIALADSSSTTDGNPVTSQQTISKLFVYSFNGETNTLIETFEIPNVVSSLSDYFNKHSLKVSINKTYSHPVYFGYSNEISNNNIAIAYYNESGNYLSGTAFEENTPISPSSGSVAIQCAIYGKLPDDPQKEYRKIAEYNTAASSVMAGNCWVGVTNQTIDANTQIDKVEVFAKGETVTDFNMAVVNANNNELVEYIKTDETINTKYSFDSLQTVVEIMMDKTYEFPVYFVFNAERPISSNGILMKSGATTKANGILYVDDAEGTTGSPNVGYVFTPSSSYGIGHVVYTKNIN